MYILNAENTIKMTMKELGEFIFVNYYNWIGFINEDSPY